MTDPSIEERKHWIRKKWIEKLDFDQKLFNVRLSKSLSSEEADRVRQLLDDSTKLKERIEGGFTPKEAPITTWKGGKDGEFIPLTQDEQYEDDKFLEENSDRFYIQPDISDIENDPETIKRLRKEREERDAQKSKILNLLFVLVLGVIGGIGIKSLMGYGSYGSMNEANKACENWTKVFYKYKSRQLLRESVTHYCNNEKETKQILAMRYGRYPSEDKVVKRFKY